MVRRYQRMTQTTNGNTNRFLDLLDGVGCEDEYEEDIYMTLATNRSIARPHGVHQWSHGPLNWNIKCSLELQQVVSDLNIPELSDLQFSVTVSDPKQADFPLVACSSGFSDLTGYMLQEIVGRNCRFLLNGVPVSYINEQTRFHARDFCISVSQGKEYNQSSQVLPPGVNPFGHALPKGELICAQTNAMKTGELFRNMFYMKQVWLDDAPYILGLQAGLPLGSFEETATQELQWRCQTAWKRLNSHMSTIEDVLAQQFWYSASMRRQD